MADREKEGKMEIQKFEYLKNKQKLLKGYHLVKNKKLLKNSGHSL